ncbi:long-chain-acyl-CoA synthetase [Alloalcanivorax marinus]|uniref:long-chain-acyl-CoA synthetase n=1 Tax=Alloalcanivorax marinus TaxID=1177169 RepID=UPI001956608D|nr:long-chain-acyl-CoA synthetase [Alloalcanivorax marinus]MBM7333490.1 long-chain-acyl-CoA synthetase [Alloalcanivorax marinus]MCU5786393.1 long-chain-acyl-CoA synthetase [Alloalcanivorax marinus]
MRHSDVITLPKLLTRVPDVIGHLPALLKGSRMSKITDTRKPVGLGVAFERAAAEHPAGIALIQDERAFTYRTLNGWANRIAHYLASLGLGKGDTVAVNLENRPELLATVIACAKLGVCAALLNTSQQGKVLVHSINLVNPKAVILGAEQRAAVSAVREQLTLDGPFLFFADQDTLADPGEAPEGYVNLAEVIRERPDENPASTYHTFLRDPLFHIYTSGTTGLPKAVVFNHGRWEKAYGGFGYSSVRLGEQDRLYCTLPFYHATGLVVCWASVIAARGGLVLARRFSASRFWHEVRKHNCTAFGYVGELCRYLHEQPERPDDADNPVHTIVGNGLRPGIWKPFKRRFAIDRIAEFYTASESNVAFTNVFNFDNTVGFSPVGYAIVKYDKDAERPLRDRRGRMVRVGRGEAGLMLGEITDKTPFDGYTDPDKTEKAIFRDVFKKGDAWFNTGDMMRDIGFRHAQFVDRLGDTFRWKGENVSTTEVEQMLDDSGPVVESVVYGVEIPGTDGRAGMAQLRLDRPHEEVDWVAFTRALQRALPPFAVPVFLRVIQGGVQTTGTFKHQKNTLKEEKYDLAKVDDPVYVLLPGERTYQPLTPDIQQGIDQGRYRF